MFYPLIIIILLIAAATVGFASYSFAPWVPARNKDLKRIFKLANLKENETFYDLGCGTGTTVIYANKNYKAKAIGIELALPLILICKIRKILNHDNNLLFRWENLYKTDLSKADVIYFFGMPANINEKLKEKIEQETKKGTRIISYTFPLSGWIPEIIDKPSDKDLSIYLYKR